MSKDKNQYWAIKGPGPGPVYHTSQWRKHAINRWGEALVPNDWRWWYRRGYRCVKVWVYQEEREVPAIPNPAPRKLSDRKCAGCGEAITWGGSYWIDREELLCHDCWVAKHKEHPDA